MTADHLPTRQRAHSVQADTSSPAGSDFLVQHVATNLHVFAEMVNQDAETIDDVLCFGSSSTVM